jgi:hypothetical protein
MFHFHFTSLDKLFEDIIRKNVSSETFDWLINKTSKASDNNTFNAVFVSLPRKTGRAPATIEPSAIQQIQSARSGLTIHGWTIDRLSRVWLLMHLDHSDQNKYFRTIENLFLAAEVNELIALYSALPVFAYPEMWKARCAEGIRNNIADVLTAIMCNNPYPAENLDEQAWNQLVLKAFFTEKPVEQIIGIDSRANAKLAYTLSDYAHERWAAQRSVDPQLWRCVGKFIDEKIFPDIQKIAASNNELEREAAALAAYDSQYTPAKKMVPENLANAIATGALSWNILAQKSKNYVLQ